MKISFVDLRPTIVISILLPPLWKISKLSLTPLLPRVSFPVTSECINQAVERKRLEKEAKEEEKV
jgi:hypothetical protein